MSRDAQVFEFGTAPLRRGQDSGAGRPTRWHRHQPRDGSLPGTNNGTDTVSVAGTDTCRVTQTVTSVNEMFAIAISTWKPTAYVANGVVGVRRDRGHRHGHKTPFPGTHLRWRSV